MGFVRYYFRLADHLSIDFGRIPRSPFEYALRGLVDTLKEIVAKLPPGR